jgi:hypothetical protein
MARAQFPIPAAALFAAALLAPLLAAVPARAGEIAVSRFATEGISGWEEKSFRGRTSYRPVVDGGRPAVAAESRGSASGLVRRLDFDPAVHRYLRWSWKVSAPVAGGDERTKGGDDYAARVYVLFPGTFFWQTKAINYIWANRLPRGESLPNAFTSSAVMVAVESGASRAGAWVEEERDLLSDYRRLFGAEPRRAGAVAIMTDTDNTGGEAFAWYGEIVLSTEPGRAR